MIFQIIELVSIISIIILLYKSIINDFEGEWVDIKTGVKYLAHANTDYGFTVISGEKMFIVEILWNSLYKDGKPAIYDRWNGRIIWNDGSIWVRYYESKIRSFPNWIDFRNVLIPASLKGGWHGFKQNKTSIFLVLRRTDMNLSGEVRNGDNIDTFIGTIIHNNADLKTHSGDILKWSWDTHQHVSTLKINNEFITLNKLDSF